MLPVHDLDVLFGIDREQLQSTPGTEEREREKRERKEGQSVTETEKHTQKKERRELFCLLVPLLLCLSSP
jgi:hypothetical protein